MENEENLIVFPNRFPFNEMLLSGKLKLGELGVLCPYRFDVGNL